MKIINIMVFFLLELLILSDITNDLYKLFVTLFLIILSIKQITPKQQLILWLSFLGDYFLAYQQEALWGLYFFILMQWFYSGFNYQIMIFISLLLPLPLIYRLAFLYGLLLIFNIRKYKELRTGFILLLISDIFIILFYFQEALIYVYLTWSLYIPALMMLHKNIVFKKEGTDYQQLLEHNS